MADTAVIATVHPVPRLARAHEQVADHYRSEIRAKTRGAGDKFPSVRDIADAWTISTNTAYKAVRILRDEGWIEVGQGRVPTVVGVPSGSM
jgi:DNA-binding transcriptional regulator YhcF (GntR family)